MGHLPLGDHHPVCTDPLQRPLIQLVLGFADDVFAAQIPKVHGNEHTGRQILTHGHNGALALRRAHRPEYFDLPGIADGRMGAAIRQMIHGFLVPIHHNDLMSHVIELLRRRAAEAAQSNYNKGFHRLSPIQ